MSLQQAKNVMYNSDASCLMSYLGISLDLIWLLLALYRSSLMTSLKEAFPEYKVVAAHIAACTGCCKAARRMRLLLKGKWLLGTYELT